MAFVACNGCGKYHECQGYTVRVPGGPEPAETVFQQGQLIQGFFPVMRYFERDDDACQPEVLLGIIRHRNDREGTSTIAVLNSVP